MLRVRPSFLALFAVLLSCLPLAAQTPEVTLEALLSAPFPEELLASPAGAKLAWIEDMRGARNVWVAEPPEYKGSGVAVSPKGDGFAFVAQGHVYWTPLTAKGEPVQWVATRGGCRQLRFSPDGSKLAFTSARGDHSFVGIYDLAARSVRWLDPGVDDDGEPAWSPDGSRVAFVRIPTSSKVTLFYSNPSAPEPWSIVVADAATGVARTVWRAEPGPGSAFGEGIVAANQLLWAAGDRIVFPWERDGWNHLYSVPAAGGKPALLTPGDFEVETVNLSPDRRQVIFSSNQDDIDRRHLWKVDAAGGQRPVALTKGKGIEWLPVMTSDGKALAFLSSGARKPARPVIEAAGGAARDLAPELIPSGFPESALVEPEPVILSASDGLRIHGQLFLPPGMKPGERHPALLFFHGGSHRQMLLGWHYNEYYNHAYAMNQYLASRGYIVLAVNYRSGIGYGLNFREAPAQGAGGASEFNDVLGAGLYLRSRSDVDPGRIGLWGGSYGGFLTAMGLARASNLFAAGVDLHGVHDWNEGIRNFIPDYHPTPEQERLAFESSPNAWLDTWRSPVLLIQGDDDRNVFFSQTVRLAEALRERKVHVETLVLPDEIHGFLRNASWLAAYHAAEEFFGRELTRR
jgi:dipeptidyl aminopeptidase/acylaminoacyl peptidase